MAKPINFFVPEGMMGRRNPYKYGKVHSRPHQRGAIGIFGALVLSIGLLFAVLSIDSGRLFVEDRRLQKIADLAALDGSKIGGICGDGAATAAQASALRNGYAGNLTAVELGDVKTTAEIRGFNPGGIQASTAVRVTDGNSVPRSVVLPGMFLGDVALGATATAGSEVMGGLSAGSELVNFDPGDSPRSAILNALLGDALGSNVSLQGVSYNGLANAQITLLDLVNAGPLVNAFADVGTVDELLTTQATAGDLMNLYAEAVSQNNALDAEAKTALGLLASATVRDADIHLGDIIKVTTSDPEAAASAGVNLLDLITTTAIVANGTNAINLPGGGTILLGAIPVQLKVIELPQIAVGPPGQNADGTWKTQARTSQIQLTSIINKQVPLELLSLNINLGLNIAVAHGNAWLQSITCPNLPGTTADVRVGAQPGIASVSITNQTGTGSGSIVVSANIPLLGTLPVLSLAVGLNLPVANPGSTPLDFPVDLTDSGSLPEVQRASCSLGTCLVNGLNELNNRLVLTATLLRILPIGLTIGGITNLILAQVLNPLITQLSTTVLDPLLALLGIEIGSLDVEVFSLQETPPQLLI